MKIKRVIKEIGMCCGSCCATQRNEPGADCSMLGLNNVEENKQ